MNNNEILSFWEDNYPLVKMVDFDADSKLCYDARANMVFVINNDDLPLVVNYLKTSDKKSVKTLFPKIKDIDIVIDRVDELREKGVLLHGPVDRLINTELEEVKSHIKYNMDNILMRKFVLETTQQCNFRCKYCHNTIEPVFRHHTKKQMSFKVAKDAIDFYKNMYVGFFKKLPEDKKSLLLEHFPPSIGFYGGEPALNWNLVVNAVDYYKSLDWNKEGIPLDKLSFSVNTNLYILTDEMLDFFLKYRPFLFVSLDGPKEDHDRNRVTVDGRGTFDTVFMNIQRIKAADPEFFKDNMLILCVEAEGNDHNAVHQMLDDFGCPISYLNQMPYGCLEKDPENEIKFFDENEYEMINDKIQNYKKRLQANDPDAIAEFESLYFLEGIENDTPYKRRRISISLTCPLCVDNIMIGTDGEMHLCHKTDGSLPLGNVCNGGYDMEKMIDAYKSYGETTNCIECRSCWAMNICSYCAALRLEGGKWKNPRPLECKLQKRRLETLLKLFVAVYKLDPNIIPKLMERKRNLKIYKSLVDYNDFIRR